MKIVCDKCGEVFESGLVNLFEHQFGNCKAHTFKEVKSILGNFTIKIMPHISPNAQNDTQNKTR